MKNIYIRSFWLEALVGMVLSVPLMAYEVPTHEDISRNAFDLSVIGGGYLREQLQFGATQRFNGLLPRDWVVRGSNLEDEYYSNLFVSFRFLNHFYDPVNNRGLTYGMISGQAAPQWALEQPNAFNGQDYSWRDARRYFLTGLTVPTPAERETNLAKTFRSIGQVIHLIQDMGSPEHTRNDIHAGFPLLGLGEASLFEGHTDVLRGRGSLNFGNYQKPSFGVLEHFWRSGSGAGFAEYTNRNFISKATNFTAAVNGNTGGGYPSPQLNLALQETVDIRDVLPTAPVTGKMTFFKNNMTDFALGGVSEENNRMTTYSIFDQDLRDRGKPERFSINTATVEKAAGFLVPRAVGYSAALIDHFFRGKLDVDLSTDPNDATVIRLEGTNGSTEKLDGGTLELYGEDANGIRTLATAVGSTTITADPGQAISANFRLPTNSEKLMAVYKGKLGNEIPQGTPGSSDYFPGGVIGKLLGRERVEQIFTDFTRWYIRNPQGVYSLPLLKSDVDDLQWGDDPNTLVGRSVIGPGETNKFYAYKINRSVGATHIPLTVEQMVDITLEQEFPFLMGMTTGTTVEFTHVLPFRQYVLWNNIQVASNWVPTSVDAGPNDGHYEDQVVNETRGIRLMVNQTATSGFVSPIILDEQSHIFGPFTANYWWDIWYIHMTADRKPLAVVRVELSSANLGSASFPSKTLQAGAEFGGEPESVELPPVSVDFEMPYVGPIWLLVDVSTGQVVANTAPESLVVRYESGQIYFSSGPPQPTPTYRSMSGTKKFEGPEADTYTRTAGDLRFQELVTLRSDVPEDNSNPANLCSAQRIKAMNVLASESVASEFVSSQLNLHQSEIAQLEFPSAVTAVEQQLNFAIDCGVAETLLPTGFRISIPSSQAFAPNIIEDDWFGIVRPTPVAAQERLVFVLQQPQVSSLQNRAKVVQWNPTQQRIEGYRESSKIGEFFLLGAGLDTALIESIGNNNEFQSELVDFTSGSATTFPNTLLFDYTILSPNFLYNEIDFKFYNKDPLQSQGLPADLATTSRRQFDRYHVVAVR